MRATRIMRRAVGVATVRHEYLSLGQHRRRAWPRQPPSPRPRCRPQHEPSCAGQRCSIRRRCRHRHPQRHPRARCAWSWMRTLTRGRRRTPRRGRPADTTPPVTAALATRRAQSATTPRSFGSGSVAPCPKQRAGGFDLGNVF
jgi:hypothetical protein